MSRPPDAPDLDALKALSVRSDARGLRQLASHLALLAGTTAAVWVAYGNALALAAAMAVHGVAMVFLFAPLHECIHRTAFRGRLLNDSVAWLAALPLLLPPTYFRAFHLAHHRWTQVPGKDPELAQAKPKNLRQYLWVLSGLPYWRGQIMVLLRHACGSVPEGFVARHAVAAVTREARVILAVWSAVLVLWWGSPGMLVGALVVGPLLLGQPFLRAYLMAEHTGLPLVPDMLRNSRTTRSNRLLRWLAWNMPYHAEHHYYPALPFHALPKAHRVLERRIETISSGYVAVHRGLLTELAPWAGRRQIRSR